LEELLSVTIIIYTLPLSRDDQTIIEAFGRKHELPVVSIHSAGFYSYFHIDFPALFPVIETHPDPSTLMDLRLLKPWPELSAFAADVTNNIESMSDYEHGHLPFVAIILHFLDEWRANHDGNTPSTTREKTIFRKLLEEAMRRDIPGGSEENFEEALVALRRVLVEPSIPTTVRDIFDVVSSNEHPGALGTKCTTPCGGQSSFWAICRAMLAFYNTHNCLPVSGHLPDMKAKSDIYVKLQGIYKAKARDDAAEVLGNARDQVRGIIVDRVEVDLLCRNMAFVKIIQPSNITSDIIGHRLAELLARGQDENGNSTPSSLIPVFLALKASSHTLVPTATDDILATITHMVPSAACDDRMRPAAREVVRAHGGELHCISAITGGLVAQEVIKIVTRQYVPIDNTCIYDGIASRCQIVRI
jgi:amyloid beta precursor protein binding protein 1